jgi:hypothetical protein
MPEARRVRLLPLEATSYEYGGREDEVPAVEAVLGVPVKREANGDIILECPMARKAGHPGGVRRAVLRPGMTVARFDGPAFRFIVTDAAAFRFMSGPAAGEAP